MKLFIVIIIVLAYWPMVVGRSLSGLRALAPIYDFSTNPCSISDAFNLGRAGVQGLPTLHPADRDHNKATGQSAAISIWTGFQVTSDCVLTSIGLPSIHLTQQQLQACWSYILHWWRIGSALLLEAAVNIAAYLLFVLSVAVLLLSMPSVQRHGPITPRPRKPTFVSTVTRVPGSSGLVVNELVGQNSFTLQGRLVLYSEPTTSESPDQWKVLFHGHGSYHSTCDPVKSGNHETQLDFADDYLLRFLLRGVSVNHPWTLYLPGIIINLHREAIKEVYAGRKPTLVAKVGRLGGAPKRIVHEQPIQRRVLVKRPIWKPTFAPSIHRIGGPQKPAVYQPALPMRPLNPPAWIEKLTIEGRLVVYSCRPVVGRPVQWRVLFDPRAHYHLTQYGDESSNCQRDMADGYLLKFLLRGSWVYHQRRSHLCIIVLDVPGEVVNEPSYPTATHALFNIRTSGLPPSEAQTVSATVHCSAHSVLSSIAPVQVGLNNEPEERVARNESEDRNPIGRATEHVPANAENDVECCKEPHHPIDARGPGQVGIGPYTPSLEALAFLDRTPLANRHIEGFSFTTDPQPAEQVVAVRQELHCPAHVLAERARHSHAYRPGATAGTRATHGAMEADDHMDEEVQQQGPPKRVKRRGGKKNALWKRKCLERRDRDDHNPEAGPSGLQ